MREKVFEQFLFLFCGRHITKQDEVIQYKYSKVSNKCGGLNNGGRSEMKFRHISRKSVKVFKSFFFCISSSDHVI